MLVEGQHEWWWWCEDVVRFFFLEKKLGVILKTLLGVCVLLFKSV